MNDMDARHSLDCLDHTSLPLFWGGLYSKVEVSSSLICQKPKHASNTMKTLTLERFVASSSAVDIRYWLRLTVLFSSLESKQILITWFFIFSDRLTSMHAVCPNCRFSDWDNYICLDQSYGPALVSTLLAVQQVFSWGDSLLEWYIPLSGCCRCRISIQVLQIHLCIAVVGDSWFHTHFLLARPRGM